MNKIPLIYIIIGVSGSGKSKLGRLLSEYLECDFQEGDRRHSAANINKMRADTALENEDRIQWLDAIESDMRWALDRQTEVVMTCSALKTEYRNRLKSLGRVQLIWVKVDKDILLKRLSSRENHYMSVEMLESQLVAFEKIKPEEEIMTIDGNGSIDEVMSDLITKSIEQFPDLNTPWWKRSSD